MASVELATGYYQLVPSMKGNKEAIVGEITGAVNEGSDKAGKEGGARLSTRLAEGLKGLLMRSLTLSVRVLVLLVRLLTV